MIHCPECDTDYASNFCPSCGQKKIARKLTGLSILIDFVDAIYSLEKSFYSNIKCLILDPYTIINRYLDGYRNFYFSPGKFFVIASLCITITFLFTQSHFFLIQIKLSNIQDNLFFLFLFIFLFSISSYFVYYLKWKRSFTAHVVINIYNISLWTILLAPLSLINYLYIDTDSVTTFFTILYMALIIIWNSRAFKMSSKWLRLMYICLNITVVGLVILLLVIKS